MSLSCVVSSPFPSTDRHLSSPPTAHSSSRGDKFPSAIFLNYVQAVASSLSALAYLLFRSWRDGSLATRGLRGVVGWDLVTARRTHAGRSKRPEEKVNGHAERVGLSNGHANGNAKLEKSARKVEQAPWRKTLPGLLVQVAVTQTAAGPVGFASLRHISYPTMVLGKVSPPTSVFLANTDTAQSCKLIPVMLLNFVLYRRRFSSHKYLVVALVTLGISMFMMFGRKARKGGSDSAWGLFLLIVKWVSQLSPWHHADIISLLLDGMTNSTQDQIFTLYPGFTGQQMMLAMAVLTQLILLPFLLFPLPLHLSSLLHLLPTPLAPHSISHPIVWSQPAFTQSLTFIRSHPSALRPLTAYALLGGLGQLFIFETIQHFGSLTLVMITVTRKLFTMLLSVVVFNHQLAPGQWAGIAVVFSGIGLEAGIKRRDVMRKARRDTG